MSHSTPPGWYPDVNVPGTERWWDGTAWTAHARAVPSSLSVPHPPGSPAPVGARRTPRTVVLAAAGLAVVAATVAGFLVLGEDSGRDTGHGSGAPSPTATVSASAGTPSPAGGAEDDPTVLVDQLNGVTLKVPEGWEKPEHTLDDSSTMRTVESYTCPGDSGSYCYHGTVTVRTAGGTDLTDMKDLAEQDIGTAADNAYGEDFAGGRPHGGIRSHEQLASESVTVAGRTGHLVRWKVTTGKGPGGYVQSLVFPSAVGSETPVIVRFAFDAGQDDLPLSLMDTVTEGIRPVGDATNGGVGSTVGP